MDTTPGTKRIPWVDDETDMLVLPGASPEEMTVPTAMLRLR